MWRIAAELIVVFVGVLLALAADDFREMRAASAEARQSLALLLEDLRADSLGFAEAAAATEDEVDRTAWLVEGWERSYLPADSLESAFWTLGVSNEVRVSRSAYSGLEGSNRLRLLKPDSLQEALGRYYQDQQAAIEQFQKETIELSHDLNRNRLGRFVIDLPGAEPGTMWPTAAERVELRVPWADVRADLEFRHLLVTVGRKLDFFSDLLREGEASTGALMAMIRVELSR